MATEAATLVVGAGPAGLATAACLKSRGIDAVLVEASGTVGQSWRDHYERLHLHTVREHSALPGLSLPEAVGRYAPRQAVVDYLEAYAKHHGLKPRLGEKVLKLERSPDGWKVQTDRDVVSARCVVICTGYNRVPHRPSFKGEERFKGKIQHSRGYRNGQPFRGQRVLVVGLGNTGGELALDLVEHGAVPSLSVRGPVNVLPRDLFGRPMQVTSIQTDRLPLKVRDLLGRVASRLAFGNLGKLGIRPAPLGPASDIEVRGRIAVLDIGTIAAIKRGAVTVFPDIETFEEAGVRFVDGKSAPFDAVILATGYRSGLSELLGPHPRVDAEGRPQGLDGGDGLYFVGFRNVATGLIRQGAIDAETVAGQIAAYLRA